jgi:hypothetical protein
VLLTSGHDLYQGKKELFILKDILVKLIDINKISLNNTSPTEDKRP